MLFHGFTPTTHRMLETRRFHVIASSVPTTGVGRRLHSSADLQQRRPTGTQPRGSVAFSLHHPGELYPPAVAALSEDSREDA